ncbi:S-layer homology domain-containing protein [Lysinibacillus sp. 2017]|nr:S-layer homology domain-containing protein [Lysinibacillus sp. 2017]TGN33382.1 S-layer homology domain-containing protein [Lysinibacillus sp. S2017]
MDRIKKIDLNKYTEAQITSIYNAYGSLSLLAKDVVMKSGAYKELMNALDHVKNQNTVVKQAKLEAGAFDEHMDKLDRNSTTAQIAAARALYNRLSYEAKKHVLTFDKLVRLETMWKDPEYIELVHTYYPDYIHAIKPGGIEITKPNYDSLYIPDDSEEKNVANYLPTEATWSSYEEMTYRSGRYMASITSSQVKNLSDRTLTLKADEIEIVLPTVDLKGTSGTVGVSVGLSNNRLTIQFTENDNAKTFSEYVEIRVPKSALNSSKYQMIERVVSNSGTAASFKVDGADFVIRTKTSGIFQGATSNVTYNDLGTSSAGNAVREFAKRGITYSTTGRSVQMTKQVTRADVATLIAKALDLSSSTKTKYQDLSSAISASRAQALQDAGIMSGVTSSRFGINTTVTKQEAAIIIANMYRYLDQDLSKAYNELKTNYTDVSNVTFEAQQSIAILELFGVLDGNGKFNPNEPLTRGQFAELLYKSLTAIDFL